MSIHALHIESQTELLGQKIRERKQRLSGCDDLAHTEEGVGEEGSHLCSRCSETTDEIVSYLEQQVALLVEAQKPKEDAVLDRLRTLLLVGGVDVVVTQVPWEEHWLEQGPIFTLACGHQSKGRACDWIRRVGLARAAREMMHLVFEAQEHAETHYPEALRRKPRRAPDGAL
jgi:hypothetical protein